MASHTVKIGTLDLSNYVRVAKEDGMDPLDADGFIDPQFNTSGLAEGAPLLYVQQDNRKMEFPLYLKGATKDLLADLLMSINLEIRNTRPLVLEWKDQGASNSTYYDVVYARFDPDYNYRRAGQNWLGGTLHVWALPFGTTGTYRPFAVDSAAGQSALHTRLNATTLIAAGGTLPLDGDVPPQMQVKIQHSTASAWDGTQVMLSTLPNASWVPIITASQFLRPLGGANSLWSGTIARASGAPGSYAYNVVTNQALHYLGTAALQYKVTQDGVFGIALSPSYYTGDMRVIAAVHASERRGINMQLLNGNGDPINQPVTATGWRGYSLIDLGRISMPSTINGGPTLSWYVRLDSSSILEVENAPSQRDAFSYRDPYDLSIAQVYVVPESSTLYYFDTQRSPHRNLCITGNIDQFGVAQLPVQIIDGYGGVWGASQAWIEHSGVFPIRCSVGSGYNSYRLQCTTLPQNDVSLEMETDGYIFGAAIASSYLEASVWSDTGALLAGGWSGMRVGVNAASTPYMAAVTNGGPSAALVASVALTRPVSPSGILTLRAKKQGAAWQGIAEWHAFANATAGLASMAVLGTLNASSALFMHTGDIQIWGQNPTNSLGNDGRVPLHSFRSHALPSQALENGGAYWLVDTEKRVGRYFDVTDLYKRDAYGQRGQYPQLSIPSPNTILSVAQPIDTAADTIGVVVSVRERFTYVR